MTRERTLAVIRGQIDSGAMLQDLADKANGTPVVLERSVLYPYTWFKTRCSVPTIGGTKTITVDCLVDSINGLGMTADAFATDEIVDAGEKTLCPIVNNDDAREIARRTVTHRLGKKLKMIAPFDVCLEEQGTVYKRFWILRMGAGRAMIDSTTGGMHPLSATAA